MRTPIAVLVSSVLTAGAIALSPVSADAADRPIALTRGHIDAFEVTYDQASSKLKLRVKDDTELYSDGAVYRDPSTVVIDADQERAAFEVPDGLDPEFDFLGDPGDTFYMLPEVQDPELPWPGWSTERLRSTLPGVSTANDAVSLELDIDGPGDVHTFMSGSFGEVQNRFINTADAAPDRIPVGSNNHVHTTWVFTEPGTYTMSVTPTATLSAGGTVTGDPASYEFHVGDPLAPITPVNTDAPKITGTAVVGTKLFGGDGVWKPNPTDFERAWLRDGQPIDDTNDSFYIVTAADAGHQLTYRTTARVGRTKASAVSAAVAIPGPDAAAASGLPSISGSAKVGGTVTATPGTWNVSGLSHSYQWLRDAQPIAGATGASYAPTAGDHRRGLSVRVTASTAGRPDGSATSSPVTVGTGDKLRATVKPKVSGTPKVGRTLKVSPGRWTTLATSYTYRWKAGGKTIKGATKRTLKLKRAQKGKKITVQVTARSTGHTAGTASGSTKKVK